MSSLLQLLRWRTPLTLHPTWLLATGYLLVQRSGRKCGLPIFAICRWVSSLFNEVNLTFCCRFRLLLCIQVMRGHTQTAVLKPTWPSPLLAEKRDQYPAGLESCRAAELTGWESGQLKGATHGLPFYVWVCSFGRIRRGTLEREFSSVRFGAVQFSIVRFAFSTCSGSALPYIVISSLPPCTTPIRICESIFIVMGQPVSSLLAPLCAYIVCRCRLPLH